MSEATEVEELEKNFIHLEDTNKALRIDKDLDEPMKSI